MKIEIPIGIFKWPRLVEDTPYPENLEIRRFIGSTGQRQFVSVSGNGARAKVIRREINPRWSRKGSFSDPLWEGSLEISSENANRVIDDMSRYASIQKEVELPDDSMEMGGIWVCVRYDNGMEKMTYGFPMPMCSAYAACMEVSRKVGEYVGLTVDQWNPLGISLLPRVK